MRNYSSASPKLQINCLLVHLFEISSLAYVLQPLRVLLFSS